MLTLLTGCAASDKSDVSQEPANEETDSESPRVDFAKLKSENGDIFAWISVPGTRIDYPVCQSLDGDDSFYITHNALKEEDPKGAIYTESANLTNMCDFNEVLHGSSPGDGTMFSDLQNFLDRKYFEEHKLIYVFTEDNALAYYIFAAFPRSNTRLLELYDFTYASGCQNFLDEIYDEKSMNKLVRDGWEHAVKPENFIITLSTQNWDDPSRQTVVVGCLVGDASGTIDREMDYSDPESDW
jgi:sortase B